MPDRLFVLDLIQHTFINLANLSLAEKQESLGRRACVISENSIRAFLHLAQVFKNVDKRIFFVYRNFADLLTMTGGIKYSANTFV